jgi:hypothetical protein
LAGELGARAAWKLRAPLRPPETLLAPMDTFSSGMDAPVQAQFAACELSRRSQAVKKFT